MLSFWRFTDSDVFDVTSSKNNVLIDFFSGRSRSVCGPVLGAEGSHWSVETVTLVQHCHCCIVQIHIYALKTTPSTLAICNNNNNGYFQNPQSPPHTHLFPQMPTFSAACINSFVYIKL